MARTPTSPRAERGAALLEAVLALGLTAMIAAAAFQAFSRMARATAAAETRLHALALAESALEAADHPAFLVAARDAPQRRDGAAGALRWTLDAALRPDGAETAPPLVALSVTVEDAAGRPLAALRTLRLAPPP